MNPQRPETPTDRTRAARAQQDAEHAKEQMRLDELHAAVLDTPRGRDLLAYWDDVLLVRTTAPDISDGALRGLEHTRNFHRTNKARIARFRDKGAQRTD